MVAAALLGVGVSRAPQARAETLYIQNTGASNTLDTATITPAAPGSIIQNYAEGAAFVSGDDIVFTNSITAATTYRISVATGTNLQVSGLTIGRLYFGSLLNPAAGITIQNGAGASGAPVANTLTLGAGGIDLSLASQNLTISQDTSNTSSLSVTTSALQTWTNRTGRTISLAAAPFTLAHNLTLRGAGTFTFGASGTGPISGAGNLIIDGAQSGGASVVTLAGTNASWTGAVTLGNAASHLRLGGSLNLDQSAASQNKLADASTLTVNNATVNLQGTGGGTETVAGVALGRGLNAVTRTAGTGVLQMNGITRSLGAAVNFGNIATTSPSHVTADVLNTSVGQIGAWAVGINGTTDANWIKTAAAGADNAALALSGADYTTQVNLNNWTTASQNIVVGAATTASTASRTIGSLKLNTANIASLDIGAGNSLTINDGANGGGIIGVGNFTRVIGSTTVGQGTLTAGAASDANADTLYLYNLQNTTTINMVIADNGTDALHLFTGGAGTVTLNAVNTFTGGITIAAGTLNLGSNTAASDVATLGSGAIVNHGSLVISKSTAATDAQMTFANNITGTGSVTINRDSAIFSGSNDYTGATNVSASTTLRAGSATGISSNSRMILNSASAFLNLNGFDVSVAALRGDQSTADAQLGANTLTLSGSNLANANAAETLQLTAQSYQGIISGTGNIVKNGLYAQNFTAGGSLTYTGSTTVNAGTLQTDKPLSTSGLTVNNSSPSLLGGHSIFISNVANSLAAAASVNLAGAGSIWQINNGFGQSIGSLVGVTDSRVVISRGAGATNLTVTDNGATPATFAGVIQEAGTGANGVSLTKAGSNSLTLSGGSIYSGATTVAGGILRAGAANLVQVIPDLSSVVVADVAGAILDLNGNNETIGSLAGGGLVGGAVTLGAGTLTFGQDNTSTSFGGVISGTGGLGKVGTGTQTLSGANTFTGAVRIANLGGQSGGGLTVGLGGSLADTVTVRNSGWNTAFNVNATDSIGTLTGTRNSTLSIGVGATLTSSYADGTATALAATADSASQNGRIVRDIDTTLLKVGDTVSGTGISAGSYVVQVVDNNTILVNQNVPAGPSTNFAPSVTSVSVLGSAMAGAGGFTKDGAGTLILTGNSTLSGLTTINAGVIQIGGVWDGRKFSLHDTIGDSSRLVFAATGTQTINFANSSTNLQSFERVGSLAGGNANSTINLTSGSNVAVIAFGGDNTSTTYSGTFLPGGSAGWIIKEGTGNFTWSNSVANVFDGPVFVDNGTFTSDGAEGFDAANQIYLTNRAVNLVINEAGGDNISFLQGGKGDARVILGTVHQPTGGLTSNYLTSVAPIVTLTTSLTVSQSTTPVMATLAGVYTFNGDFQGTAALIKSGNHLWRLTGASTNAHTGETQVTGGTLQLGVLSRSAGVGMVSANNLFGTLSTATGLRITGGTLDINGTAQAVARINASSTGGTIALGNGSLTLSNQDTQSTATTLTGGADSVLNLNASSAATLTMTGNSNTFNGTYNVGANAALTVNLAAGVLGDAARINLNGTGTQLTVTLADTVGSLAGTGNAVLTQGLSIREGWSGTSSAAAYAGATSGAGALTLSGFGGLTVSGNLAHAGGVTVSSNAALNLSYGSGNNILPGTGALTLNGGSLRVISTDFSPGALESVASTTLGAGASSVRSLGSPTGYLDNGADFINLAAITRSAGGTVDFGRNAAATSTANAGSGILGAYATFDQGTWAVANGATTAISGLGAFSANVFGTGLHVDVTSAGANAGGLAETLRFSGSGAADITGATTISTGGILVRRSVGANPSTISGALSATGNELIIHQHNPSGDLILSNIAGTNTVITTGGAGRTLITGNIAGSGSTNLGYGYLQLGDGSAGGSLAGMVGSGAILNNGTLGINRSNAVSLAAVISGTGNLEQLGTGTTTLGAANTFAGRVTVRGGTLEVTNNAGLGLASTGATNRWANLTSVNASATLLVNVAAGGTITEFINLDGGTLDLRSALASTFAGPIVLSADGVIRVSNTGAAVSHVISGEIFALPGSDLSFTGVTAATRSTLVLSPTDTVGSRWEGTTVGADAIVQVGTLAGSRGFLGTGSVNIATGGTLAISTNNDFNVIANDIAGAGTLALNRGNNYLTGDLSAFTGALLVTPAAGQNINVVAELGNDTYGASFGTGAITVTASAFAGTSGIASVRTHFNQAVTLSNTFNLNPANDGTNAKNAQIIRAGLGNVTLSGTINLGATNTGTGGQRSRIQTEAGGALFLNATLAGGGSNNLLEIVNNNIVVLGGSASQSYHGVLSGNNTWVFENSGTTTLLGVNAFNTGNSYLRAGTLTVGTGGVDTMHSDNDLFILPGATLALAGNETIGQLLTLRDSTVSLGANTLTLDDNATGMMNGAVTGTGNLVLGNYAAIYGTNSATGTLTLGTGTTAGSIQTPNLTNAIGSFTAINLGASGNTGAANIEYVGPGETFANNLNLSGTTAAVRITANGTGALTLAGNITNTGAGNKTLTLSGQTGGYFNPIINRVTGAITEGANVISLSMPNTGDDDRFGITGRWALTNATNDFSGSVTVGVGMLEFAGDLKTGVETTSVAGDLSAARTFTLASNNFNGRRYDMYGSGDQLAEVGFSQGTNTLAPNGSVGTVIFNDPNVGTANLTNITWAMPNITADRTSGLQLINSGTKQVNLFNAFTFGTTGTRVVVLDGSNTLANTINGVIANPSTSQNTRIDKEGAGTWRLAGANTYTGATNVNDGILELAGGNAIENTATVAINGDGGDGIFSGTAKLRIVNSETIGLLSGDILTEAEILTGQTLTIAAGNSTMNGLITGAGNLTRTMSGSAGGTLTTTASNTYTGVTTLGATGTATANAGISITQLANGGIASGLGASSSAAANLVFTTNTSGANGGILTWTGITSQSTDRLFTMGLGAAGARINASGTAVGTVNQPAMTWSNTGVIVLAGTGTRTLILGGSGIVDNVFRPAITDGGGATSLSKVDGGMWMIDPAAGANTFSGGVSITGGTLAIKAGNALGNGTITINGGTGVGLEIREGITLSNAITNSTGNGGFRATSGNSTLSGLVTVSTSLRLAVDAGASINISNATSALTGAGGMLKLGAGNLILSGTNGAGWTSTTDVRSGTLTLDYGTNNTGKLADSAALTLGGIGAITITGADSDVGGQGNLIGSLGGTISLSGGSHAETVASVTIDSGANAIIRSSGTSTINLNVITRGSSQGTINFGAAGIATTDTSDINGILGLGYATITRTDWARSAAAAADSAITALATYAVDSYGATNNVDVTNYATVGSAANTLRFNTANGGTLTQTGVLAMTGGGLLVTPNVTGGDVIITGGQIQHAANNSGLEALIIHQHSTRALQIDSVIQNNTNAQALTKTGAGTLYLGGLNTFTGNVNLFEGTIQVGGTAAAPTIATNAFLSGLNATPAANGSAAWNLAVGTTLRFLTTNTTIYNSPTITGEGTIELAAGNQGVLLVDDDNVNFLGTLNFFGGTIRVGNQASALGRINGRLNLGGDVNFIYTAGVTNGKFTTFAQGTTVNFQNNTPTSTGTWSGEQRFNNTTRAGLTFNLPAPTTGSTVGLTISGVIYGTSGFTKTGNGILQLSGINFTDVYDGYAAANKTASLSGQIAVNGGVLYVGNARALGAHGAGNEVIVASGASLDLRGAALNYGDDSDLVRKLIHVSGTGFTNAQGNATGALRSSSGTGQTAHLKLQADTLINSGGTVNGSLLVIGTFDSNLSNANNLAGAFTRNAAVIDGGGFELRVQGGRVGTDNFIIADPSFTSALGKLIIQEGGSRFRHEVTANIGGAAGVAITSANITNGVEIAYAGLTAADLTGGQAGGQGNTTAILGANVGARLLFENWFGTRHTVNLIMNGVAAAAATGTPGGARSMQGGNNVLQADFGTIPDGTTYLDGTLTLTGAAERNLIVNDSVGNYSVVERGNLVVAPATKLVFGGIVSGSGGFTKQGQADVRFTADNTFSGDVNVLRIGSSAAPWESRTYRINGVDYATNGAGEGWAEWSLTLNGANGAFSDVANINLQRRGMLTLDNTNRLAATSGVAGGSNSNRIADDAVINMQHGWLRLNTGSAAVTEALGTLNAAAGSNIVDLYGTDGAGVETGLSIATLNRSAGATIRFTNLDANSTFGATAAGESARVSVGALGTGAALFGGAGANNSSTRSIAQGVFGGNVPIALTADFRLLGFNNGNVTDLWNVQRNAQFAAGSHFMTMEGGFLRPLDDDEYFTVPTGVINPASLATVHRNVNLSEVTTVMSEDSTVNALRLGALADHDGTGVTGQIRHHSISLFVDGTLKISSGMVSSGYWTIGNTASATTQLIGGALDFNGKEAIINNQSAFFRLTDGAISGGDFNIASAITNASGLTKTGFSRVNLQGANTYAGVTTVSEGLLDGRHGRSSFGIGGEGNGIVVIGSGSLRTNNGVTVGSASAREDIYVGILAGDQQFQNVENDLTQWFSNITIDNVDAAGHVIFTPRIRAENSATNLIMGHIAGGDTRITNDVLAIDPRTVEFNSAGNNVFIMRGQFGDRYVGGVAAPIADPISQLPTLAGVRTNENEVLRVNLGGGSDETNLVLGRNYNSAGRLTIIRGTLIADFDPASVDGSGFWTSAAISKIPNADSVTTAFDINGGTAQQGFTLGTATNNYGAIILARPGQVFNMASWTMAGSGAKFIGGINESGTVTFGNGTGSLTVTGATPNLYATDGGTVVFDQRFTGNVGTSPSAFGIFKAGRGQVTLQNTSLAAAGDSNFVIGGGTLLLNHTGSSVQALVGNQNARFDGGTLISLASTGANTTASFATNDDANRVLNFNLGGTEIVARTVNAGTARNMVVNMGNGNANATTSNFTRGLGVTANLVEDSAAGGAAQITLQFNASTAAAVKNQVIPWATYGTLSRTATDFAMSDAGNSNDVRAYTRALDEYQNNVASWAANSDVSENAGAGFYGSLGAALTLSTLRFDANADSTINLGTNVLTLASSTLAQSGSALLLSSGVGAANKTITGGAGAALTASGGRVELILHHFGTGNLNLNVPVTGAGVDLVVAGPSTTNASTIGTTGAVVLGAVNTYDGQTFINGSVLSFSNVNQLGTNASANAIVMSGGTLRYTGSTMMSLGTKGIDFLGSGGTIDVTDGAGELYLDTAITSNATYRGDLVKVGAGTLTLNGTADVLGSAGNPDFRGLIDVRQGTLRLAVDHGNNTAGNEGSEFTSAMGTSNTFMDGTVFRPGTNFAIQMGNANNAGGYSIGEWLTFEGNNYVSVGTINSAVDNNTADTAGGTELSAPVPNPNSRRNINLNGVNTIKGTTTFDVVNGQTLRLNNGGFGYTTGAGDIIKDGQGTMVIGTNIPEFTGAITILQGRLYASGQADNLGTGYSAANGSKFITLGSASRQGIAELAPSSDSISGATFELNHDLRVVYNPAQTKRLLLETFASGSQIELNGSVTLNDNLVVYINDGADAGGSANYVNLNGRLLDGALTSGNLVFASDDTGNANDNTNGRVNNFLVLRNDNSLWTGDVRVSIHTSYDQDENAILRLEAANALGIANDVDMGFNSILQVGGSGSSGISGATSGNRIIGSLSTNGGVGPFTGGSAGGTMGASVNGVSAIIENAATTAGTLVITQSTPASVETIWNAHFRDGTLNSEFFAPGASPVASASLNIVKAGDGWATLQTDNAYTGTTTVSAGILQVGRGGVGDTGAAGVAGNRFSSAAGTTVAGTGVIQGNASIAGSLRPGDEAGGGLGTLVVNGSLALSASAEATLQLKRASYTAMNVVGIHGATYGAWSANHVVDLTYGHLLNDPVTSAQHDKLLIAGALSVAAGGRLTLANAGYNPTAGDIINVADWTGSALALNLGGTAYNGGRFRTGAEAGTDLNLFELGYGLLWDVSQFNSTGNLLVVEATSRNLYWRGDQSVTWGAANAGDTNWLDAPAGQDPGSAPVFTDNVFLSANTAANLSTVLGQDFSINSLTFTGTGTGNTAGSSVGGNTLTLNAREGSGLIVQAGSGANTISSSIILGASQTWTSNEATNVTTVSGVVSGASSGLTKAGAGLIALSGANTFSGAIQVNGGTLQLGDGGAGGSLNTASSISVASGATFSVRQNDTVTQGVDFSGAAITGAGGVTQAGTGTLVLNAANTYAGATTISAGTLVLSGAGSATSGISINGGTGTTLRVTNPAATGSGTIATLTGVTNPVIQILVNGGGTIALANTFGGNSAVVTTIHVDNNGSGTNGVVQLNGTGGSGYGNSTLNVTGANGYSLYIANLFNFAGGLGTMTFNPTSAALELGNLTVGRNTGTGTFILGGTNTGNRVSGVISNGSGANLGGLSAVTKNGAGTWTLTGANTYTGATLVSAGTLVAASGALAGTSGITVNGATLTAADYNASATLTLNASGSATISGSSLTISGAVTNANTATNALNFTAATGKVTLASLAGSGKTRFGSDADITGGISAGDVTVVGALGANITGGTVSAASLTGNVGGGAVTLTGLLTGNVTAGTVTAGSMTGDVGSSVTISGALNGAITAGTNSIGSLTSASVTGGTNTITGAATVTTINGGTTSIGGVADITTLTSGTVNLTAVTGSVTNVDGGTLTLTGTALTATNGTGSAVLTLNAASTATFSGAGVTLGAVTNANTSADALNFTAVSGKVTLASLAGAGKTRFGSDADITGGISVGEVTVIGALGANITGGTVSAGSLTAASVAGGTTTIGGVAAITTLASGTLNLNGATATITNLNGGTIALGTTALTVSSGTFGGVISGANGSLTKSGLGSLILTGANTFGGGTTISAGTLQLGDGGTTGSLAAGDIANDGTLIISRSDDLTLANKVTGSGAFSKLGAGNLTLTGASEFTGAVQVDAGTLSIGHATALGTAAAGTTVLAGAALRVQGGITVANEAITISGTGVSGNGALRNLSGINTLGGAIVLGADTLIASAADRLVLTGGVTGTNRNLTITGAGDVTIDALGLSLGTGSLTMSGTGVLLLNVANSFADTTINSGTIKIGHASSLGTGGVTVAAAGTLDLNNLTITNPLTLAAGATLTGGSLPASSAPTTGTLDVVLTGSTPLVKADAGRLELTGDNTFTAPTSISAGTIAVADFGNGTTASPLGITDLADPEKLVLSAGATLEFNGATNVSTARSFKIDGSGTIAATGTGALVFNSDSRIKLSGDAPELTLASTNPNVVNRFEAELAAGSPAIDTLKLEGAGRWILAGPANRFKGDVRVEVAGSTLGFVSGALGNNTTHAASVIEVGNGARLAWSGSNNTDDISSRLAIPAGATAKLDLGNNTVTFASAPTMGAGASLQKEGAGTLRVSFSDTTVNVGVSSGLLSISQGASLGAITVGANAVLGGRGTVASASLATGAILSPGNSPGTFTAGFLFMPGGSIYDWQVQDATNHSTGYDKLTVSGNLDLRAAAPDNRVILRITSLLGAGDGNTPGRPLNFDPPGVAAQPSVFQFGQVGGVLLNSGQNISDVFEFDLAGFTYSDGSSSNAGLWSIAWDGGSAITLTAVPEPSTYGFGLGALALAAAAIRRRRKQKAE